MDSFGSDIAWFNVSLASGETKTTKRKAAVGTEASEPGEFGSSRLGSVRVGVGSSAVVVPVITAGLGSERR